MKKLIFLAVLLSTLSILCKGYGTEKMNQSIYTYGYQRYEKEIVDSIQGNGMISLEGTKVLGLVLVNGSLNAEESVIDSLQVNGQAVLKDCLINHTATINGALDADNTKFQKELSVVSQRVTLRACSIGSLIIREVSGYDGIQVIDLRGGTKVIGAIVVESGKGEIWLSSNSEIPNRVSGAKIIRK